jgi:hypothetical protein
MDTYNTYSLDHELETKMDPTVQAQVEHFVNTLRGRIIDVVSRTEPDPSMPPGALEWRVWERRRRLRIFADGKPTRKEAEEQAIAVERDRRQFTDKWRTVAHGWAKWARWRRQAPQEADAYRRQHQDAGGGDQDWLVDFASRAVPRIKSSTRPTKKSAKRGVINELETMG